VGILGGILSKISVKMGYFGGWFDK
jgi:hypothetical protein